MTSICSRKVRATRPCRTGRVAVGRRGGSRARRCGSGRLIARLLPAGELLVDGLDAGGHRAGRERRTRARRRATRLRSPGRRAAILIDAAAVRRHRPGRAARSPRRRRSRRFRRSRSRRPVAQAAIASTTETGSPSKREGRTNTSQAASRSGTSARRPSSTTRSLRPSSRDRALQGLARGPLARDREPHARDRGGRLDEHLESLLGVEPGGVETTARRTARRAPRARARGHRPRTAAGRSRCARRSCGSPASPGARQASATKRETQM